MRSSPRIGPGNITSILIEAGVADHEQVERGVLRQRETGRRIGETLVEMGVVTEEDIGWALSRQLALAFVDVHLESLDRELVEGFPEGLLRRTEAVPLVRSDDTLSMAVADPTDGEGIAALERAAKCPLTLCIATPTGIRAVLDSVFGSRLEVRSTRGRGPVAARNVDILWDHSGATFLLFHVATALKNGSPEIHFLSSGHELHVLHRTGGLLVPSATEPAEVLEYLLARIEALGGPALGEGDVHASGRVICPIPNVEVALEISLLRGVDGVAVVVRLYPERAAAPSLDDLGLEPEDAARLRESLGAEVGLVILCAPRDAGASTTAAALLAALPAAERRILAFEPHPAAQLPAATRLHWDLERARTQWEEIATAQGADIVVLDEVLMGADVAAVLSSAASHRLLIVTTDWTDTFAMLEHLLSRPQARAIIASRLLAVLQLRRVVRRPQGRDGAPDTSPSDTTLFEALHASDAIRQAIRQGATAEQIRVLAVKDGFRSLAERAQELVGQGRLDAHQAARALA